MVHGFVQFFDSAGLPVMARVAMITLVATDDTGEHTLIGQGGCTNGILTDLTVEEVVAMLDAEDFLAFTDDRSRRLYIRRSAITMVVQGAGTDKVVICCNGRLTGANVRQTIAAIKEKLGTPR